MATKEWRLTGLELLPYRSGQYLHIDVGRRIHEACFDPECTYLFESGIWVQISVGFSSMGRKRTYHHFQTVELTDGLFEGDWKYAQP